MITSKTAKIKLSSKNITRLRDLGYDLPSRIGARGHIVAIKNSIIDVSIEHIAKQSTAEVTVLCDYCNTEFITKFTQYNKGRKNIQKDACFECKHHKQRDVMTKYALDFKEEFSNSGLTMTNDMGDKHYPSYRYVLRCENNHLWDTTIGNFRKTKYGCPTCSGEAHWTHDDVNCELEKYGCQLLSMSDFFETRESKIVYICKCGNLAYRKFSEFLETNACKICNNRNHYDTYLVGKILNERGWTLLSEYSNNSTALECICDKGHNTSTIFSNFLGGTGCKICNIEHKRGENHPNYNPYLTDEERISGRKYDKYNIWVQNVYAKDNYICQACGFDKGGTLNAHHKDGYNWCKDRRLDISNGVTLCECCHKDFHHVYGYGNNTEQQFGLWLNEVINHA